MSWPNGIGLDGQGYWHALDGLDTGETPIVSRWLPTTHAWARKHPDDTLWLAPLCGECYHPQYSEEYTYCIGSNPHDTCPEDGCSRGGRPFRRMT